MDLAQFWVGIVGTLMAILIPFQSFLVRTDDMLQEYVETATNTFVNQTAELGYIDADGYMDFVETLGNTHYIYKVNVEHESVVAYPYDSNAGYKKQYNLYNKDDILGTVFPENDTKNYDYVMKNGDYLKVTVTQIDTTLSGHLKSLFSTSASGNEYKIRYTYGNYIGNTKR